MNSGEIGMSGLIVILLGVVIALAVVKPSHSSQTPHKVSTCNAPCQVIFPLNTQEDQFDFNYWVMAKDHHPRLEVWVKPNY